MPAPPGGVGVRAVAAVVVLVGDVGGVGGWWVGKGDGVGCGVAAAPVFACAGWAGVGWAAQRGGAGDGGEGSVVAGERGLAGGLVDGGGPALVVDGVQVVLFAQAEQVGGVVRG